MDDNELVYASDSSGRIELQMTRADAASASHSGSCDADVAALLARPDIAAQVEQWDCEALRRALKEYGAWTLEDLDDHAANCARMVWTLAGDIADGQYDD
jgi:hypothetical protein